MSDKTNQVIDLISEMMPFLNSLNLSKKWKKDLEYLLLLR